MPALLLAMATVMVAQAPDTTLRLARGTAIEVTAIDRPVVLRTGAGDRLRVQGARIDHDGGSVEVDGANPFLQRGGGPIILTVPTWATVELATMSGAVTVEDAPERLDVETVSGAITAKGGRGTMALSTMAGRVAVTDFTGTRLEVEAVSGEVRIDGATGTIRVESVNQTITLRNIRSSNVTAETTNGSIRWEGALEPRGRYTFGTHNGEIVLHVPANTSARLRGSTFTGTFESELPATTQGIEPGRRDRGGFPERDYTATLGSGEATVHLETFNGSVRIRRLGST